MMYKEIEEDFFDAPRYMTLACEVSADCIYNKTDTITRVLDEVYHAGDELRKMKANRNLKWNKEGMCVFTQSYFNQTPQWNVANLITKKTIDDCATYETIGQALTSLCKRGTRLGLTDIAMPEIGTEDGLDWEKIKDIIHDVFKDSNFNITVVFPKQKDELEKVYEREKTEEKKERELPIINFEKDYDYDYEIEL